MQDGCQGQLGLIFPQPQERQKRKREKEEKERVEREKRRNEEEPWNIISLLHPNEGHLSHTPISGLMMARGKRCTNLRVNI